MCSACFPKLRNFHSTIPCSRRISEPTESSAIIGSYPKTFRKRQPKLTRRRRLISLTFRRKHKRVLRTTKLTRIQIRQFITNNVSFDSFVALKAPTCSERRDSIGWEYTFYEYDKPEISFDNYGHFSGRLRVDFGCSLLDRRRAFRRRIDSAPTNPFTYGISVRNLFEFGKAHSRERKKITPRSAVRSGPKTKMLFNSVSPPLPVVYSIIQPVPFCEIIRAFSNDRRCFVETTM